MIEYGNPALTSGVRECWRKSFTMEDPHYTEYFFRAVYKPEYGIVDTEDGKAAASLIRIPHEMMFNGRILAVSFLSHAATLPECRGKGYMNRLMDTAVDICSHHELLTFIRTNDPEPWRKWGFEPVMNRVGYTLNREDVKRITNFGCAYEPSPVDMLKVYSYFIRRFNGFMIRDLEYFVRYKKEIASRGGKIVAYYDARNHIQGYAVILLKGREASIEECVYLDSMSLNKLINAALQERRTITVHVSPAENLSLIFPQAVKKEEPFLSARLNDPVLFSRLYGTKAQNVQDVFAMSRKPLNMNETV